MSNRKPSHKCYCLIEKKGAASHTVIALGAVAAFAALGFLVALQ
jgi:hypothetical protein